MTLSFGITRVDPRYSLSKPRNLIIRLGLAPTAGTGDVELGGDGVTARDSGLAGEADGEAVGFTESVSQPGRNSRINHANESIKAETTRAARDLE